MIFKMEINQTTMFVNMTDTDFTKHYIRLINFILSCTGLGLNFFLIILLFFIGRRQCTTYFLLLLMAICDFLHCTVYVSIMLTLDQYLNIINHQIMCPLSFFLTPFTFTGSILLLFMCLLHLTTNYVRKYDTVLGQLSGRLSVVFILAFIIIRSVLSTTSVELITLFPETPQIQYCTIDMQPPPLVATFQKFNHVFTEVTDILVYFGWIIILFIYLSRFTPCRKFYSDNQSKPNLLSIDKPLSSTSLIALDTYHVSNGQNDVSMELSGLTTVAQEVPVITSRERHDDVSSIILSISCLSILLYLPLIINKSSTMYYAFRKQTLLNEKQINFLQIIQQTALLFCLSIRFLPYLIFDKRIRSVFNQMIGVKFMKIERRRYRCKPRYHFHCQWYRRQEILEFNLEDNHPNN